MGLSCPSYPLAQEVPPPLIPPVPSPKSLFLLKDPWVLRGGLPYQPALGFLQAKRAQLTWQPAQAASPLLFGHRWWSLQWNWSFSARMKGATRHPQGYCPQHLPATASGSHSSKSEYWLFSLSSSAHPKLMGMLSCSQGVLIPISEDTSWQESKCLGWALEGGYRGRTSSCKYLCSGT